MVTVPLGNKGSGLGMPLICICTGLAGLDTQRQSNPARGGEGKLKLQTKICPNWSHHKLKFKLFSLIHHNKNNVIKAKDFVFILKQQQHQMLI